MDSLFPENLSLEQKMESYMETLTHRAYEKKCADKKAKCEINGKEYKPPKFPKISPIPPKFTNLDEIKKYQLIKSVLPTTPMDLMELVSKNIYRYPKLSLVKVNDIDKVMALDKYDNYVTMLSADGLKRVREIGNSHDNTIYFCVPSFTVDVRKFSYANNTKNAAELILDVCGSIEKMVRWGDYETGTLDMPHNMKHSISLIYLSKKPGKDPFIYDIVMLEEPLSAKKS